MPFKSSFLFKGLTDSQLQRVVTIAKEIQLPKGQWLFQEGQAADKIYILSEGSVEFLTKINGEYELPIKIVRSKGECMGTTALITPHIYSLSSRSTEDATLFEIKCNNLQNILEEDSAIGYTIIRNLAQHLLGRLKETRQELKIHFRTLIRSMRS
jgi:CRP/FNR family transcriptional regulator